MPSLFSSRFCSAALLLAGAVVLMPAHAQETVGDLFASDASVKGSVLLAGGGTRVMSGSSVAAGEAAALLKLARGGEVRVCPRTTLSVSTSSGGRDLMLAMGEGAIETNYSLPASADAIMTPDFRILLAGPGNFHFAFRVDGRGDTCMRALAGNSASLIVSELMGDAMYQVRPDEQVTFHGGRLRQPDAAALDCGCPPAAPEKLRASAPPPEPPARTPPAADAAPSPAVPSPPEEGEVHVQVDAPFVFRALDPEPVIAELMAQLRLSATPQVPLSVLPPPAAPAPTRELASGQTAAPTKPERRGFFGKVRAFFAAIFH